ncbi:hypothetical protein KGQ20_40885 [Catenulispora sp. NF23]|uniref:Ricin B lectin domain-containing protein n=1 Tax=Catenulispora pinistramenti TaxID=2705254 RepID=A0ABS5KYV2_9ACTN|nr:RICIN domain-containing protein [Catenulispora pinistramenti]MBS2539123.1 hypothetical protein [Catenulispora pinistramenti]MBS2551100.1 hypothetical protein [Catenulispora pinistramenti]
MHKLNRIAAATFAAATALGFCATAGSAQAATARPAAAANQCLHKWTFQSMGLNDSSPAGYLNVDGGGGNTSWVITWYSSPSASNEYWCMEPASEGGWYFHPSYDLSLCMDVPNGRYAANQDLWIHTCNGTIAQRFTFGSGDTLIRTEGNLDYGLEDNGYGHVVTLEKSPDRSYWR